MSSIPTHSQQPPWRPVEVPPTPPDSDSEKAESDSASEHASSDFPLAPPSSEPTQVLDLDKKTPDSWLPRDPRLIRLTGVHPFNVEAPLSALYNETDSYICSLD